MKSLIKFFPVAVGVLALASCSNDDFFGSSSEDGKLELVATVAAPVGSDDGLITRSVITPAENVADYSTSWQTGDVFRVYDAQLQKYDAFSYKSGKVTIDTEDPKVTEYAKAIFPGESVSYAGWSADNDAVTATVKIEDLITYEPAVKVGEKTAYVSNLPMWGDATKEDDHLAVKLNPLTAYADITVNGAAAQYIRVISAAAGKTNADFQGVYATAITTGLSTEAPLTGYFDAMLVEDGKLVADYNAPLKDKYGYVIKVDMGTNAADEAHVIVPIVAQTYPNLIIQYSVNGTANSWVELKNYPANTTVANNVVIRKDLVIGAAIVKQDAKVSKFSEINDRLNTLKTSYNTAKVYNLDLASGVAADAIKTSAGNQTITIPDFAVDKIINLNFDIDDTGYALTIDNNNTGATVLNLKTIKGSSAVTLMQGTNSLTITGEINSTGTGESKRLIVKEAGNLTLGLGDFGPFKSNMNLYLDNDAALTIAVAEGNTIAAIDAAAAANASTIDVVSGTVTAIGGTTAAATPVTVESGAIVGSVKTADAAAVTVKTGATATSITTATGTVTVNADATVSTITTGDAIAVIGAPITSLTSAATGNTNTITATASIGTLKLAGAAPEVTLTGATAANKDVVKIEALQTTDANNPQNVTLTSTNKAAVGTVTFAKTGATGDVINATSSITASKAADIKTDYIGTAGEIYTAAQLAGVTTGKNYKLMADIDVNSNEWAPVNLNGTFDGNKKTISEIAVKSSGGLFGTISGGEVKDLTIDQISVYKAKTGDMGALAGAATGTVAVTGVKVIASAGTNTIGTATVADIDAKNINYGGLFGTTNGTITLTDNQVTATINAYGNAGGFIGNVKGGSVTIKTSKDDTSLQSEITFQQPKATNAANAGTFGNFIGTISGNGVNITIGGTAEGKGGDIAKFFNITNPKGVNGTNSIATTATTGLNYKTRESGDKKFVGMKNPVKTQALNYEIGYCSATTLGTIFLYNTIKDNLGNEYEITLDNINVFE